MTAHRGPPTTAEQVEIDRRVRHAMQQRPEKAKPARFLHGRRCGRCFGNVYTEWEPALRRNVLVCLACGDQAEAAP